MRTAGDLRLTSVCSRKHQIFGVRIAAGEKACFSPGRPLGKVCVVGKNPRSIGCKIGEVPPGKAERESKPSMFEVLSIENHDQMHPYGTDAIPQRRNYGDVDEQSAHHGAWRRMFLGNVSAAWKSAEILISGGRVFNAAAFALALTAIEDAQALHSARRSCRSTLALLAVEQDHALRGAFEAIRRLDLLTRIARDAADEAAYPLRSRFGLLIEDLRRAGRV